MDNEIKKYFWKELELLQPIIDKFDDFTFRIKNWFMTIFIAVSGYSIVENKPELLKLNILLILVFYFYEAAYRTAHAAFLKRCREIQELLRKEREFEEVDKMDLPPHFGKYLFEPGKISKDSKLLSLMLQAGFEERRARETLSGNKNILIESWKMLFQLRVSLIYIAALVFTLIISNVFLRNA